MHHTIEVDLSVRPPWFWLPTLPAERYDHVTQTFDVVASQEYVTLTKCQPCHSRLVPLRARQLNCVSTLHVRVREFRSLSAELAKHVRPARSLNMSAHIRHHQTWQLDRVRASCLTTRLCAKLDVRYVQLRVHRLGCQSMRGCSRSSMFIACYLPRWLSLLRLTP